MSHEFDLLVEPETGGGERRVNLSNEEVTRFNRNSDRERLLPRDRTTASSSGSSYGSMDTSNQLEDRERVGDGDQTLPPGADNEPANEDDEVAVTVWGPNESIRCICHKKPAADHTTRKAVCKLVLASVIALFFMAGEVIGGHFANSLAIMTDAAHMLSDFAGFLISLFAIWVSRRPPSRGMSFGWYRAEVLGALVSVLFIWVLTGVLFYEAVLRVVHRNFEVKADIMLITACAGVFVNVFMCMVLGHGHGHSHGGGKKKRRRTSGGANEEAEAEGRKEGKKHSHFDNINVRAAFIHVIGDLIQSIGVVIAGYIIWFKPTWKIVDPICTFIFCVLVLISTFNILKDALRVVMEGTPKHIDYEDVKADLNSVEGVKQAHSLHIWSITLNRTALAAHLALEPGADSDEVLARASEMLKSDHQITQTTLQVEGYHNLMDDCGTCQEPERSGVLESLLPNFIRRKLHQGTQTIA